MEFNSCNFEDLDGGKDDEDGLKVIFTTLGFNVMVYQNITANVMTSTVEEYSCKNHKEAAFILIILSHGGEGDVVYGTDGGEVEVEQLKQMLVYLKCSSLMLAEEVKKRKGTSAMMQNHSSMYWKLSQCNKSNRFIRFHYSICINTWKCSLHVTWKK